MTSTRPSIRSSPKRLLSRVNELQKTSAELKKQLDLCRSLSDEAADPICTVDMTGIITYANKASTKLLKIPLKELLATHFSKYLDKGSLLKGYECFSIAKSGKKVYDELNIVDRQGKVIPVDFHTTPLVRGGKVVAVHAVVRDISRRKALERTHIESQKMQALYHFIAAMAQEIKYPLKAISDRLARTLQEFNTKDFEYIGYKEYKQIIAVMESTSHQIEYCYDITHRMINLNKRNLGVAVSKCDVNEVIRSAVKKIDGQIQQLNVRMTLRLSSRLTAAAISAMELQQALTHLFVNAVQSMPTGGKVVVTTLWDKNKSRIVVLVKDEGVGIARENLPHIFEPFFSTKQHGPHKGSGLGLSIAHSIIHAYRGDIFIDSSLRTGTVVRVELPAAAHR